MWLPWLRQYEVGILAALLLGVFVIAAVFWISLRNGNGRPKV